jgi:hypothetical protein
LQKIVIITSTPGNQSDQMSLWKKCPKRIPPHLYVKLDAKT